MILPYPYEHTVSVPPPPPQCQEAPSLPFASHTCKHETPNGVWEHVCMSLSITCQRFCLGG